MAGNYSVLKAAIEDAIKTNGNNEITGALLQSALLTMINSLGANYQYAGVAVLTPTPTQPGTPDQNVFYIATQPGTYSNFSGLVVADNEVAIFKYNGSWTKDSTDIVSKDTAKIVARGVYVDYKHLAELDGSPATFTSYKASNNFDALHVRLASGRGRLSVTGAVLGRFMYFSSAELIPANYIGQNTTGNILSGAEYVVINLSRASNPNGYANLLVYQDQNYIYSPDFYNIFGDYIRNVPTGKNFLDANNLLVGYQIASGEVVANAAGRMSNRLYLSDGETYTIQGIPYYGTYMRCYYAKYNINGDYLGAGRLDVTDPDEDGRGTGTFTFNSNNGQVAFIRFCVQASTSATFDASLAQIERGNTATAVEPYTGQDKFFPTGETTAAERRKVRILVVGNSYSQDAFDYVPFILPGLAEIDAEIGILYHSGANLQQHYNWIVNDSAEYTFYWGNGKAAWQNIGTKSLKSALSYQHWDMIVLQQQGRYAPDYSTYQPYLNNLITEIFGALGYPVKFVWYSVMSSPGYNTAGGFVPYTDEQIIQNYEGNCAASQRVLNETLCEAVIPVATAVQNARTTDLNNLGDYGKLTYEGVHLQEGLPCQLAAYAVCMSILALCGYSDRSIFGDTTRATAEWLSGKSMPGPNGSSVGATNENCRLAQMSAIMARKKPFEVTDISQL